MSDAPISDRPLPFDAVVAGVHLRYDGVWQRPQQLLSRLAQRVPVLYVEEPFPAKDDAVRLEAHGTLDVLRPLRRAQSTEAVDRATIEAARAWAAERRVLVWLYTPMMSALADAFDDALVVYDCMDELAAFDFAPPEMKAREDELCARATFIFCGGRSLYESRKHLGDRVRLYPSALDFEHFAAARTLTPHPLLQSLEGRIYGYFGAIDERIDRDIVAYLARDAHVVMIGPIVKVQPNAFERSPRLHFTGQQPYALLPQFLAGFDVAIMPFALNAATKNISPTKTPEYLAAGKPVVSTRIADVVRDFEGIVEFASDPASFAAAAGTAFNGQSERRREGRIERARRFDWNLTLERMLADIL